MIERLIDVVKRDVTCYGLTDLWMPWEDGVPFMWTVAYPTGVTRIWYEPIEDEL